MHGYSIAGILLAGRPLLPAGKGGLILIAGGLVMVTVALLWLTVAPPAPVVHRPVAPARPARPVQARQEMPAARLATVADRAAPIRHPPKEAARHNAMRRAVADPRRRAPAVPLAVSPETRLARRSLRTRLASRPRAGPSPLDEVDAPLHVSPATEGLIGPEELGWAGFVTRRAARTGCQHVRLVETDGRHCTIEVDHDHHHCHRERRALARAAHEVSRKASIEQVGRGDTCVYEIHLEGKP